uniref:Urocortin-3-like n=1 Tax=Callorhinchus milii TaxID=7868 RepID=A0A4W3JSG8_CALMI|eukprot:gi/632946822/ref/XP_007888748.1/ PREDICTED: urocortin-3-like [Callorhinchus milii]
MFSQTFLTLSALLVVSGISVKSYTISKQRFEDSGMEEEEIKKVLTLNIHNKREMLKFLLSNRLQVQKSKRSPDQSSIKMEDSTQRLYSEEDRHWLKKTFPFQYPLYFQTREISLSRRDKQGTRFTLSLDVPTNILSILIDLAKAKDMRAKAAANAELMAQIGK